MLNSTGGLACKGSYPSPSWISRGDKLCMSFLIAVATDEQRYREYSRSCLHYRHNPYAWRKVILRAPPVYSHVTQAYQTDSFYHRQYVDHRQCIPLHQGCCQPGQHPADGLTGLWGFTVKAQCHLSATQAHPPAYGSVTHQVFNGYHCEQFPLHVDFSLNM